MISIGWVILVILCPQDTTLDCETAILEDDIFPTYSECLQVRRAVNLAHPDFNLTCGKVNRRQE